MKNIAIISFLFSLLFLVGCPFGDDSLEENTEVNDIDVLNVLEEIDDQINAMTDEQHESSLKVELNEENAEQKETKDEEEDAPVYTKIYPSLEDLSDLEY